MLEDRVAVVTGGGQGLGRAIALAFAAEGARVLVVGRQQAALDATAAAARASGGEMQTWAGDVTAAAAPEAIADATCKAFGRWDSLVNCAGAFFYRAMLDIADAEWENALHVNLTAPFRLMQAMLRRIAPAQGGSVINIGSLHGAVGDALAIAQCASKAGVLGLTRAAAEACRPHHVTVNAIAPGAIEPASADRRSAHVDAQVTQADVAQIAVFLASARARCITGTTVDAFGISRPVIGGP